MIEAIRRLIYVWNWQGAKSTEFRLLDGNALELAPTLNRMVTDSVLIDQPDTLIYANPPYVMDTRKGGEL